MDLASLDCKIHLEKQEERNVTGLIYHKDMHEQLDESSRTAAMASRVRCVNTHHWRPAAGAGRARHITLCG